ncbi:pre-mRNA-splicing factor Slu7-like [Sitophilus oryzae]|uniref:Pre-mRNA-splicing factor SLU7 n=1 Tax=Sitophilus oryzae TaxID=7048 RepID=A0A6J2XH30_SITOR|nr:pre-mRNA-splicing factor Slu7-like [Sitophilus oryzae]
MANPTQCLTVSQILKRKAEFDDEPRKKSREDRRKAKELEEARKAGTAPAAVDEEGKDINPHIPQYISNAPWYYATSGPTLRHQRPQYDKQQEYSAIDEWYRRGLNTTKIVTKYRKGACENCGAMTHKKKDCMDRPRKVGAKYSNTDILPDEFVQKNLSLSFDGKRDRWSGYNPLEHISVIEEFQKVEDAKRQLKAEKLDAQNSDNYEDEDKYVDEVDMPGTKVDSKQRITVRNLRIREDTAKYLRNLDPNSAYYDPKTRSMRENPNPGKDDTYKGENFVRFSGATKSHATAQLFAWEAYEKGVDVHLLAEPTKLELLQKEYEKKKEQFKTKVQSNILEKYGGEEHLEAPPKTLLLAQTEGYVEYSRSGKIMKGQEKEEIRSKYEEDIYINNHTSVWGSYWKSGQWSYKCCHSFIKNSYCLGESGKSSNNDTELNNSSDVNINQSEDINNISETTQESELTCDKKSDDSSENDIRTKSEKKKKNKHKEKKAEKDKLSEALKAEEQHQKQADYLLSLDERKRPYNSMFEAKKPTEEEIEAYYLKRKREEDPMSQFL